MDAPSRSTRENGDPGLSNGKPIQLGPRQLRTQIEDLTQRVRNSAKQPSRGSEHTLAQGAQELRHLADWIESLAQLLEASPLKHLDQSLEEAETYDSATESIDTRAFESQLQEMRLRVATLDVELKQAREQLNQRSNRPHRTSRKRKHRSLWRKIKQRLLLS